MTKIYTSSVLTAHYVVNADGTSATKLYDATGALTTSVHHTQDGSTYTTLFSDGVKTRLYVDKADGTHDTWSYNVQGKSYTTELQRADASGKVIAVTRTHADGSLDYTQTISTNGIKVTTLYDATGHKTTSITVSPSATTTSQYDTSGNLTREIIQDVGGSRIDEGLHRCGADRVLCRQRRRYGRDQTL